MSTTRTSKCDNCQMGALDDLVDDMAGLMGAPCTLEDPSFQLLGFSGQREVDLVRQRSILERGSSQDIQDWFNAHGIRDATAPVRTPADRDLGIVARLCVPARHLGRVQGYFWLLDPENEIGADTYLDAMRIADTAGALLGLAERKQAHRDALYRSVIEDHVDSAREAAAELANAAGLRMDEPVTCILVRRPGLPEQLASRPTRAGTLWVREDDQVSAVVIKAGFTPDTDILDDFLAATGLGRRVSALDAQTTVGVGPSVRNLDDLARSRTGATVAFRVARHRDPGTVMRWEDLGPLTLLGVARDRELRWATIPDRLAQFLQQPSVLVTTVATFLDEAGSVARTAERLRVHRQTIYHRLSQVEEATGLSLRRGEDRLRLHLAIRLVDYVDVTA